MTKLLFHEMLQYSYPKKLAKWYMGSLQVNAPKYVLNHSSRDTSMKIKILQDLDILQWLSTFLFPLFLTR